MNICNHRCETCEDFKFNECLTCKSTPDIEAAPSCQCSEGFTDYYNE